MLRLLDAIAPINLHAAETDDLWRRSHRVFAYEGQHRVRYLSLAWNREGQSTLMFTRASRQQEAKGRADVMMIRSTDQGEIWTEPVLVYAAARGEPRTMGTLTRLASGRLIAGVSEMGNRSQPLAIRMIRSGNDGSTWQVSDPIKLPSVPWARLYGRLIQIDDGKGFILLIHVTAGLGPGDDKTCAGLMRSTDRGKTWSQFPTIATDAHRDFADPAVLATDNNSLLALLVSNEHLFRCQNEDGGNTWTTPLQVHLGREPNLLRLDQEVIACMASKGQGWEHIWVGFTYDNGRSWRCDRKVIEHPGEHGGHFGWPAALTIDERRIMIAFGHTQMPSRILNAPANRPMTPEQERIEVIFFDRERPRWIENAEAVDRHGSGRTYRHGRSSNTHLA